MPTPDRVWYEERLEQIRQQKQKLLADYNATCGAEQLCQQALALCTAEPPAAADPPAGTSDSL